jgi:hypothetical protein
MNLPYEDGMAEGRIDALINLSDFQQRGMHFEAAMKKAAHGDMSRLRGERH